METIKKTAIAWGVLLLCLPLSLRSESEISKLHNVLQHSIYSQVVIEHFKAPIRKPQVIQPAGIKVMDKTVLIKMKTEPLQEEVEDSYRAHHWGYYISISTGLLLLLILIIIL